MFILIINLLNSTLIKDSVKPRLQGALSRDTGVTENKGKATSSDGERELLDYFLGASIKFSKAIKN